MMYVAAIPRTNAGIHRGKTVTFLTVASTGSGHTEDGACRSALNRYRHKYGRKPTTDELSHAVVMPVLDS